MRRLSAVIGGISILVAAAQQPGCAHGPLSGEQIRSDLRRDGIPLPAEIPAPDTRRTDPGKAGDPAAAGSQLPPSGVSLADLLLAAERRNPELAAARAEVGVAAGRLWQAGLYPNPSADVRVDDYGFREGWGSTDTTVGVVQPIVLGDRLRRAVDAASAERAASLAALESTRRDTFGRIARLHARVIELREQEQLLRNLLEVARETLSVAQARFDARAATEPDVIRPRVEVYRLDAELQRVTRELDAAETSLGLAVDDEPIRAERLVGALELTPAPLDDQALARALRSSHPDLLLADREAEAATARLERIEAERVPDLDVRLGVGYSEESNQGIATAGLGMTIPLWDSRQGDLLASRFDLMRVRRRRAARENELLSELATAWGEYEAARGQLATLRDDLVPEAERAFGQISASYRAGRASFLDMLDAQRTLMEARRTMIETAGAASRARATLGTLVGAELLTEQDGPAGPPEVISQEPPGAPNGAEDTP